MNKQQSLAFGSFFAMLGVILGAFGAHYLRETLSLSANHLQTWNTAVQYQFYHALALLFVGSLSNELKISPFVSLFFALGICLFSGSLYFLSLREVLPFSVRIVGPLTPIGGVCFIIAWASLFYSFLFKKT